MVNCLNTEQCIYKSPNCAKIHFVESEREWVTSISGGCIVILSHRARSSSRRSSSVVYFSVEIIVENAKEVLCIISNHSANIMVLKKREHL